MHYNILASIAVVGLTRVWSKRKSAKS